MCTASWPGWGSYWPGWGSYSSLGAQRHHCVDGQGSCKAVAAGYISAEIQGGWEEKLTTRGLAAHRWGGRRARGAHRAFLTETEQESTHPAPGSPSPELHHLPCVCFLGAFCVIPWLSLRHSRCCGELQHSPAPSPGWVIAAQGGADPNVYETGRRAPHVLTVQKLRGSHTRSGVTEMTQLRATCQATTRPERRVFPYLELQPLSPCHWRTPVPHSTVGG